MPLLRTVQCDICNKEHTEEAYGKGFPEWMLINGIELDGNDQVWLCPEHMAMVANFIDSEKQKVIAANKLEYNY